MRSRSSLCRFPRWLAAALLLPGLACTAAPEDTRPSILLVVFDTVRKDAVSAYGAVEGTTPNLDELARSGLIFPHAFAPSPWTLPSHATLFTGLPMERHGVGLGGRTLLADETVTLAERLRDAGYDTAGFSENPLVGADFQLNQGFAHYAYRTVQQQVAKSQGADVPPFDVTGEVARWLRSRRRDRPFFVFVNLFDPHDPYTVRESNRFVAAGVDAPRAWLAQRFSGGGGAIAAAIGICDRLPSHADIEILKGLYHGEVAAADAKLGAIRELLLAAESEARAESPRDLITVATADHGEHLGEHRLLGHEFSVRNAVLNVPLVVHGLPSVAPGVRTAPVELTDVAPSVLHWAEIDAAGELPGRRLPESPDMETGERAIVGIYVDEPLSDSDQALPGGVVIAKRENRERRRGCGPEDRVFGTTIALTRFPHKLIWFEKHPSELYDLSWDRAERSDRAAYEPELVSALERELAEIRRRQRAAAEAADSEAAPSPDAVEALRSLGYVE